jgi:16S rRNA (cytidine1402-2'-O)-methyltransferase
VASDDGDSLRVLRLLLQELPLKTAVRLAAEVTGASRNACTTPRWNGSAAPRKPGMRSLRLFLHQIAP